MSRRPLSILFLVVLVDLTGFGIVIPLLPMYARDLDANGLEVGLLITCFSAAQLVAAPLLGALSDRVGRRPVLVASLAAAAVSYVIFGLAKALWLLFVARSVAGLCGGNISAAHAYIADVSSTADRARAMGLVGAAFGLGFVLGPLLGALFADISLSAPFFFAAGLSALAAVVCLVWLPEPSVRRVPPERVRSVSMLREREMRLLVGCVFVSMLAFAHLETVFALYNTSRFGVTAAQNALLFGLFGAILVIAQAGLIGPISRRYGAYVALMLGMGLFVFGLLALALAPSLGLLIGAVIPTALGTGLMAPSILSLISVASKKGHQGQTLGISQSASVLGRAIGPLSAGALFEYVSQPSAYLAAAAVMSIAFTFAIRAHRDAQRRTIEGG